jgi:hypothetical protein
LIHYCEAGAVAFRAFVLDWADDGFFHVSLKPACQSPVFPTEGSQGPVPQPLRIALARFGRLNDPRRHDLIDDARLSGVVKVFAGRVERLAHDFRCAVIKPREGPPFQ